ncbi:segregation/condensation protein A [Clostridium sp. 'deep sea']|uniref:segregation and condensation protein A n=1 Tax=Clostridium sp. 'deep sea' TaxID=2779445 RepID=UPI00189645E1|nr:segregation/condensation protein A [Clostridium sp. 'deep sea']QOR35819.1 segregation/condensation protein A [Clostridium sp. 'deep sea']
MDFTIATNNFDGPLDLLLHLVQKKKLDITLISIAKIVDDYISYINENEFLDLAQATAFLDIATILLKIKVRSIFPRDKVEADTDDSNDLMIKLIDKHYYSVLADMMVKWEDDDSGYFKKGKVDYDYKGEVNTTEYLDDVTLLNLAITFEAILSKFNEKDPEIKLESYTLTVSDQINWLKSMCRKKTWQLKELFYQLDDKFSVVVTFLALLECIKDHNVIVVYESPSSCLVMINKEETLCEE